MSNTTLTVIVICATVVALIAYDVYIKVKEPDGNATISWVLLQAAKRVPLLAFAFGVIFGHIFFPNCP
jgi:hypothetical protein